MSHDLPLDWYEDHDGQSLVLSSEKVAAEIEEQRTIRVGLADQLKGVCDVNASLEKEIERLKEAKRKFSLLCDEKGAENVKLRQENERLRSLVKLAADAWAGGSQDGCCVACMSIAEAPPQAFVEAKKERDEGWPGMGDAEQ